MLLSAVFCNFLTTYLDNVSFFSANLPEIATFGAFFVQKLFRIRHSRSIFTENANYLFVYF